MTTSEVSLKPHLADVDAAMAGLATSASGLSTGQVRDRLEEFGQNALEAEVRTPAWKRFIAQFKDLLILILLAAAVVSFIVSREVKTPVVVLIVVLTNALIGFIQENRAEASLDALRRMLSPSARVRRDGQVQSVATVDLVPGDIVIVEAGDRVPADGRIVVAVNLEIDEAALTGESHPVGKDTHAVLDPNAGIGDRRCMAYMNTTVTRGRAEIMVTTTGMSTEIGRIAGMLKGAAPESTPLQRQLNGLAHSLALLSAAIVALVFIIGMIRGSGFTELLNLSVALAVATIPEGLPAVTAVTLAIGVSNMAKRNAIVKRLASVETLGCTSVICSDKTGTLTLNEMTAVRLVIQNSSHEVSGSGYSPDGSIEHVGGDSPLAMTTALLAMSLCNDSVIHQVDGQWTLVGDPTEGALTVLARKGGIDVDDERRRHPRIGEVPFDSTLKMMATVHHIADGDGDERIQMFVKGAPDVVLSRATMSLDENGTAVPIGAARDTLLAHNEAMAREGMRVLAIAQRELPVEAWDEFATSGADPAELIGDLTLMALVGIVDPPRPEARLAIREAHEAGIKVKMITGDHGLTAAAIGAQLELSDGPIDAVTGHQLDQLTDDELEARIDDIEVFARVAPEHKMRLVGLLQKKGNVVAMTGDGVNDAPALKKADMGIAMGITGTEVTKEAATMVLTDDNFATIVGAVKQGRTIYDNIVKFVRFQLSTTIGFALLFLVASLLDIAKGKPFAAIAILWVNIIMDGPPAMALGLDPPEADVMRRRPRPMSEKILTRKRWGAILFSSLAMAVGTLGVLHFVGGPEPYAGRATVAGTMAFNTFVLFQFFNILNCRSDTLSVFRKATFKNSRLWIALVAVLVLQVGVTHFGPMQELFDTTSISFAQWMIAIAIASSVLWIEEAKKLRYNRKVRRNQQ